jgi:hypothetical protein
MIEDDPLIAPMCRLFHRGHSQPTGEIGPGEGCVPGEGGVGTSMSGPAGGVSGGGCVG